MPFNITLEPGHWTGRMETLINPFNNVPFECPENSFLTSSEEDAAADALCATAEKLCSTINWEQSDFILRDGTAITIYHTSIAEECQFVSKDALTEDASELIWSVMKAANMLIRDVQGNLVLASSSELLSKSPAKYHDQRLCTSAADLLKIMRENPDKWDQI
ncbi:hypothetical protein [Aeoliella sp. SH292]|uniref:hypothetical protein n=1 Tax=Aeoliella sp. SH292 TaxID=3454464 RepID=UPI003F97FD7F